MKNKRHNSRLIPYYFKDSELYIFLQRRIKDVALGTSVLGGFGGGIEGQESAEQALIREMDEELQYTPRIHILFGVFESENSVTSYYTEEVLPDFDKGLLFCDGIGEWHKAKDVVHDTDCSQHLKRVIMEMLK